MRASSTAAFASLLALLSLTGCSAPSPTAAETDDDTDTSTAALAACACPADKIDFTKKTGCQNDGSVEFCVPKTDVALQDRIKALEPDVTFLGSGGRARCDTTTELLGMYPTVPGPGGQCKKTRDPNKKGALKDSAWRDICAIASEPAVRKIVHTFYE